MGSEKNGVIHRKLREGLGGTFEEGVCVESGVEREEVSEGFACA